MSFQCVASIECIVLQWKMEYVALEWKMALSTKALQAISIYLQKAASYLQISPTRSIDHIFKSLLQQGIISYL